MQVTVSELRAVSEQLFLHLERKGYSSVELSADYYWNIPKELRYNPYEEPKELDLGQLTDDWANLCNVLEGKTDPLGYALVWLSTVLRAVGETVIE
ncbi:hypothetical protein [Gloeocapsopsis dulcis]|uniref:Uncharacterized protein n=1 Tax=Gloeocapsopsis dulcis AAB1 = 1H9 TaxID=1433147 RepID=A0A6N8FVA7_9CHRO|nr:hypothetical protein [Gloeocapsopsis dulcis]MUL36522.1 hypothetical protein [Gloeocapsopsis dulcis AAB1 = 1H9]WNN87807.1 hypothetical protein P0S91_15990 [Gloeocapsopsis dulcis]